jgi:phosphohistidine phosphatase SixA
VHADKKRELKHSGKKEKTTLGSTVQGIKVKNRREASSFIVLQASGLSE